MGDTLVLLVGSDWSCMWVVRLALIRLSFDKYIYALAVESGLCVHSVVTFKYVLSLVVSCMTAITSSTWCLSTAEVYVRVYLCTLACCKLGRSPLYTYKC